MGENSSDGKRIKIPKIEETSRNNFKKFGLVTTADLEGRPTRVLKKLVDTGIERHWWSFDSIVELVYGKEFVDDLKAMRKRMDMEAKNGTKIR